MADLLGFIWSGAGDKHFNLVDPAVGNLEFDCIDAETHEWNREITTNPVENASPIADHIIEKPDQITITGMISNAPIRGYLQQIGGIIDGSINDDLVAQAFAKLDDLRKSHELVTIYTRYHTYNNMLIQSINIPRAPDAGDAIIFTIQAIQVRIVTSQTTTLPKGLGIKKTGQGAGKSNSKDAKTQNRGGNEAKNGKASQAISLLQGSFNVWDGIKKAGSSVKDSLVKSVVGG